MSRVESNRPCPDPAPLIEVRDALQRCVDMIESDMTRGKLWQYTYDIAFTTAVVKAERLLFPARAAERKGR